MSIEITTDATAAGSPLTHFWSLCVGAGRANEGLRANWLEQLKLVREHCGFRYCRFHGLFHDDMFVYRLNPDGSAVYNFQYIDELFDRMLKLGVRPFVEFGFCPGDLARERGTVFWWKGHGSPPKDYNAWAVLIDRTVRHWIDRYGAEEVRCWYFEVWNEPNLHPFFKGTRTEYFELYRVTVQSVKAVDPALRVGGPATSNFVPDGRFAGETEDVSQHEAVVAKSTDVAALDALEWRPVWLENFLQFCQREHLPVDFVSCHPYPTDWALDATGETVKSTRGIGTTTIDLHRVRQIVDAGPYPAAEIHLTEWSSSPSPRDFTHDYLQAATFIVRANLESIGLVDSLSYWTFTDVFEEGGAGDTAFHGGFGMVNYQGIPKPAFHAYRFLNRLGDVLIARSPGIVVTRHRATGRLTALAYHYPPEVKQSVPASFETRAVADATINTGNETSLQIRLTHVRPRALFAVETVDANHGCAMPAWQSVGAPGSPTPRQIEVITAAAFCTHNQTLTADESGRFTLTRTVAPWSIVLLDEIADSSM